jgi:hypothetical protein
VRGLPQEDEIGFCGGEEAVPSDELFVEILAYFMGSVIAGKIPATEEVADLVMPGVPDMLACLVERALFTPAELLKPDAHLGVATMKKNAAGKFLRNGLLQQMRGGPEDRLDAMPALQFLHHRNANQMIEL